MFFTRSIRRKMVCGLVLILLMLLILSFGGISGLRSYRNVINDLDVSLTETPRRSELTAAIARLSDPILRDTSGGPRAVRYQQHEFKIRLAELKGAIREFRSQLDRLPPTAGAAARRSATEAVLSEIERRIGHLGRLQELLDDADRRSKALQQMFREVACLQTLAEQIPDHQDGLNETLKRARQVYRSRFRLVCVTGAVALVLFFGFWHYGYRWIFAPLRQLHQGARRVAQGDFDYRLELHSHDEMAELAESFNKMTARFQEITRELDRQVRERSKQLVRSERLAGVGFLAAGVAHEINNPLSAVAMAAESLESRTAELAADLDGTDAEVLRQYLGMIQKEAFRCRQITTRLLDFARGQDAERARYDLTALVSEVLDMVQHMSKFRDRTIAFDRTEPCHAEINGSEIKQVVLNLVANALESMPAGGTLRIDVAEHTDHVVLTFADDGCGMTPEVIDHLFEPFYTQKPAGKGTGLGLSISHRIVSDHGGTIEATSDGPGQGSTFRVHLPRQAQAREAA